MLKIRLFLLIAIVLYFTGFTKAVSGEEADNQQVAQKQFLIILDITDGSRVVGAPSGSNVTLNTSFAKLDIPWEKIQSIELKEDKETILVKFQNGDRLTGALYLKSIELKTIFGEVSIGIRQVKKIVIQAAGKLSKEGLVAYYPFNGNANDESGNGNNGTVNGAVLTKDRLGNENSAFIFNGKNNYIEIPKIDLGSNSITMAAWVYIEAFNTNMQIVQKDSSIYLHSYAMPILSDQGISAGGGCNSNKFGLELTLDGQFKSGMWSKTPLEKRKWYFIASTYNGSEVALYLNGILDCKYTAAGKIETNNNPVRIGNFKSWNIDFVNGIIDDVRIYNRSLTELEIRELHN